MLVHRMNRLGEQPVRVVDMLVDPHGEFVCLLDSHSRVMVLQVLAIMRYFQIYRLWFKQKKEYSCSEQIPIALSFKASLQAESVNDILLSEGLQGEQFFVFVYASKLQIVVLNFKKAGIKNRRIFDLDNEIARVTFVGRNLYAALLTMEMVVVEIEKMEVRFEVKDRIFSVVHSTPQSKQRWRRRQIMRFCQQQGEFGRLWQSTAGVLMSGANMISSQFYQMLVQSNSLVEYQFREKKDFIPIKYRLSACRQYLLGSDQFSLSLIRSRRTKWAKVYELVGNYHVEINPYWTAYLRYKNEAVRNCSRKKAPKSEGEWDRFVVAEFGEGRREIVVKQVNVDLSTRKKVEGRQGQPSLIKYAVSVRKVVSLVNVKHPICGLRWVGLCQLIYLQQQGNLYFVEFSHSNMSFF